MPMCDWSSDVCSSDLSLSRVLTLCNPMDCSTPGLPVHHQLPELTQTHVHHVGNAIQLSYPLSSPSPPAFNLSTSPAPTPSRRWRGWGVRDYWLEHRPVLQAASRVPPSTSPLMNLRPRKVLTTELGTPETASHSSPCPSLFLAPLTLISW